VTGDHNETVDRGPWTAYAVLVRIRLNGEACELPGPLTVTELLAHLAIDSRRIAVELNLTVLKRATFDTVIVNEGDEVEVVNFVGGGSQP
jgi:thiamine biosynthesis protein ThiS